MSQAKKWVCCSQCGCQVSTEVPPGTQIRAWIRCYKCHSEDKQVIALQQLISSIRAAAVDANWCDMALAEAIIFAEKCIPKHLKI